MLTVMSVRCRMSVSATALDNRRSYREVRIMAFAPIDGRLHVAVYTNRGDRRRIISRRKSNRREQATYAAAVRARLARG